MIYVSDRYKQAMLSKRRKPIISMVMRADNLDDLAVQVISGSITIDGTADSERTLSAEVVGSDKVWSYIRSGTLEMTVSMGYTLDDGSVLAELPDVAPTFDLDVHLEAIANVHELDVKLLNISDLKFKSLNSDVVNAQVEMAKVGVFFVDQTADYDRVAGTISITGADRAMKIVNAKHVKALVLAKGTNLTTALTTIINDAYPYASAQNYIALDTSDKTLSTEITMEAGESGNPWLDARALAKDNLTDIHFDGAGMLRYRPSATDTSSIVMTFKREDATLLSDTSSADYSDVYNGVIVTCDSTETDGSIVGQAWNTAPNSATNINSAFGKKPKYITGTAKTIEEACAIATKELAKVQALHDAIKFDNLCYPILEPEDKIAYFDGATPHNYIIDRITLPLTPGTAMSIEARYNA